MDNADDISVDSNGQIIETQAAAVATTSSKLWTIQKRDTSNKYVEKKIQKDKIYQKVENAEITSRSSCKPNWGRDKNYNV